MLVIRWRTDPAGGDQADSYAGALDGYLTEALDAQTLSRTAAESAFRLDGGYAGLATGGDDVALVFAPTRSLATASPEQRRSVRAPILKGWRA